MRNNKSKENLVMCSIVAILLYAFLMFCCVIIWLIFPSSKNTIIMLGFTFTAMVIVAELMINDHLKRRKK